MGLATPAEVCRPKPALGARDAGVSALAGNPRTILRKNARRVTHRGATRAIRDENATSSLCADPITSLRRGRCRSITRRCGSRSRCASERDRRRGHHAAAAHARWLSERAWQSERLTARRAPHGSESTRGSRSGAPCSERREVAQVPQRAASAKSKARRALELRAVVRPKQKTSCRYVSETCDGASSARFRGPARNRRGAISSCKSPETPGSSTRSARAHRHLRPTRAPGPAMSLGRQEE